MNSIERIEGIESINTSHGKKKKEVEDRDTYIETGGPV
jgi:hypothetical protein